MCKQAKKKKERKKSENQRGSAQNGWAGAVNRSRESQFSRREKKKSIFKKAKNSAGERKEKQQINAS